MFKHCFFVKNGVTMFFVCYEWADFKGIVTMVSNCLSNLNQFCLTGLFLLFEKLEM